MPKTASPYAGGTLDEDRTPLDPLAGRRRLRRLSPLRPARTRRAAAAHQNRQHARADRAARRDGPRPQGRRRDLRRAAEQARRPARPAGRVDRQGRPVEARPRAHALRAAPHRRQGRPADGPVRDRRDPVGDGRRAALRQGARPPHVRHPVARQVRQAVPGVVARPRSREHGADHGVQRAGGLAQAAEDDRGGHQQVPVGALHVARRARGREEARAQRGAVPRMGLRQPRLRADRRAHQGRQARLPLGRRHRARGQRNCSKR